MTTLHDAAGLASGDSGLAVVSTLRADHTIQASLVNAGVLPHPATRQPALGFVTYGQVKLNNLRARPQLAAVGDGRGTRATRRPRRHPKMAARTRPTTTSPTRGVHRLRRHSRQLERVRPRDGRTAPHRGAHHADPDLQQRLTSPVA